MELAHEVIINSPNLRVLHLKFMTGATFGAFRTTPMQLDRCLNVPFKRHEFLPSLEELGLEAEIQLPDIDWTIMEQNIDWAHIRRLNLQNDELAETLLTRYGDRLSNLRSLKLSANRSIKDHSLRSVGLGVRKRMNVMAFIESRRFEELEIMGFTRDEPVHEITNSGTSLQVLRLSIQLGPAILSQDLVLFDLEVLQTLNECCPSIDCLGVNGSVEYGGIVSHRFFNKCVPSRFTTDPADWLHRLNHCSIRWHRLKSSGIWSCSFALPRILPPHLPTGTLFPSSLVCVFTSEATLWKVFPYSTLLMERAEDGHCGQ